MNALRSTGLNEEMPMQKFLIADDDLRCKESNRWFKHCRSTGIPYVFVRTNNKTATVEWDYITFPNELDQVLDQNEVELVEGLRALRTKYGTKQTELWGGNRLALFRKVPIDVAENLAEDLFDLVGGVIGLSYPIFSTKRTQSIAPYPPH